MASISPNAGRSAFRHPHRVVVSLRAMKTIRIEATRFAPVHTGKSAGVDPEPLPLKEE